MSIFGKVPLKIKLRGITNDETDYSVDIFQSCVIPLVKKFNDELDIQLKIHKRAFMHHDDAPDGEVDLNCGFIKFLRAV
jgi:RNA 3'-terminal phosphate cyclase